MSECIPFNGTINNAGYGVVSTARYERRDDGGYDVIYTTTTAHRFAYAHAHGIDLTRSQQVHHTCHNRACINLEHLELMGTSEHASMHSKERHARRSATPTINPEHRRTKRRCEVDGCDRAFYAKGLCSTHYHQERHAKRGAA